MKKNFKLFIVTIMTLLLLSVSAFAKTDFPDVPRNNTELSKAIYTLADAGIVGGYEDGCFRPNNYLTRAELCKMVNLVFKYTEKDITNFPDVKVGDWFYDYVLVAKKAGYIKGFEDGTFRGGENLTREQTCIIISRTAGLFDLPTSTVVKDEISFWAKSDVMKVIANFVMPVDANSNFRAKENITRGELAMALDAFVKDTTPPSKPSTPSTPSIPPSPSVPTITTYTVKFYDGNGVVISTQTVEKGKGATAPTTPPTKTADKEYTYTFSQWDKVFTSITSNLSVYPVFDKKDKLYTVNLNYGDGTTGNTPESITMTYNQYFSQVLPAANSFSNGTNYFAGWYSGDTLIDDEKYSDLEPLTLTARWVSTFTVNFYNGDGSIMKTETVKFGKNATAPTTKPSKADDNEYTYTYIGWDKTFTNVTSNLDVHASFNKSDRLYKVNLTYGTGATGTKPPSVSIKYNQPFSEVLPQSGFSNGTKYFAGWYSGDVLVSGQRYSDLKPTTLTAKWVSTFTVNFYDSNGFILKTETVKHSENATPPAAPAKPATNEYTYSFTGWSESYMGVTKNLDIYPEYKETAILYTVNLDYGSGTSGTMPQSVLMTYNQSFSSVLPQSGFTNGSKNFAGWYVGDTLVDSQKYSDLTPTTLTAKWVSTFTVTFYNGDGSIMKTETVKYGKSATAPAKKPTRASSEAYEYTFTDWDKSFTNVTRNLAIYPIFSRSDRYYTVYLNYSERTEGNMPASVKVPYNGNLSEYLPINGFTNLELIFTGWYSGSTLIESQKYSELKPSSLTTGWSPDPTVVAENKPLLDELDVVLREINAPLADGFTSDQLYALEPVQTAIELTMADGNMGYRVSKQYILDYYRTYVNEAIRRTKANGFDKEAFKFALGNNLSSYTVDFLLDFFDVDIEDYV